MAHRCGRFLPDPEDLEVLELRDLYLHLQTYWLILLATVAKPLSFSASLLALSKA